MNILGLWDGHDSGAALIVDGTVVAAINEERLSRRKLEIAFPTRSIAACCELAGVRASDIDVVAASTSDAAKTLGRVFPSTKEQYYRVRRRKAPPGRLSRLTRYAKYRITEWPPTLVTRRVSARALAGACRNLGIVTPDIRLYDHHACHAATAAEGSGFDRCAVVTIDGVGDGLSATVSTFESGRLTRLADTPARHSPGVFFEHITNLLNMRELEDEGKVMALADYASPVPDADNPLLDILRVDGLRFQLTPTGPALVRRLREVLWWFPNEQFAFMAQRALERACRQLATHVVEHTGLDHIALAGGVASNVKAGRHMRLLDTVSDLFVFPHMGDGGLALGAALLACREGGIAPELPMQDLGWGPSWTDDQIRAALDRTGVTYDTCRHIENPVADMLTAHGVVMWFQGRMEYGPRALGHRSILARADCPDLRDRLNLVLKRRVWYQPFCPSLLASEAATLLADFRTATNRHMTMAYMVNEAHRVTLAGVMNVDGSCRPHIVDDRAADPFAALLRAMKTRTGHGVVLNTSFNVHGEPLVCSPDEALRTFRDSGADALAIGSYIVRRMSNA